MFSDFIELHGDHRFADDKAIITGVARLDGKKIMFVGHRKGRTTKDRIACNFGMPHPEGFRKALIKMKLAEKFKVPIVTFMDTTGAYPGIGAEERGIAESIAENLFHMSRLETPVVCVVIGEGASGGALGIGLGDRILMLENSYYSVITPEGCAAILWRSAESAPQAAEAFKLCPKDLLKFGVIDEIVPEPPGGAHRNPEAMAATLKTYLLKHISELEGVPVEKLIEARYEKFRRIGQFIEDATEAAAKSTEKKKRATNSKETST
jgi:acetyl-CoA carboxylase carboxyl transferase subunit alpha